MIVFSAVELTYLVLHMKTQYYPCEMYLLFHCFYKLKSL